MKATTSIPDLIPGSGEMWGELSQTAPKAHTFYFTVYQPILDRAPPLTNTGPGFILFAMKADLSLTGGKPSPTNPQKHGSELHPDKVWAMLRRLNARLTEIENAVSILKRDAWRIERKYNREVEKTPSEQLPQDEFSVLFRQLEEAM